MSTRSTIAILNPDNTVTSIWCHWDGYLDHHGRILSKHYTSDQHIRELMALGHLSILGKDIGEQHLFENPYEWNCPEWSAWEKRYQDMCFAYGRDRGEKGVDSRTYNSTTSWMAKGEEYNYLWDGAQWLVSCSITGNKLMTLTTAFELQAAERASEE